MRRGTLGFLIFPKRNRSERDHVFINGFTTHYNLHLIKLAVFQSVVLDLETGCDLRICQLRRWTLGISFVAVMVRKSFRRTLTSMERKEPIPSGGKIGCIGERGVRSRQRLFQPRSHSVLNQKRLSAENRQRLRSPGIQMSLTTRRFPGSTVNLMMVQRLEPLNIHSRVELR